MTPNMMMGRFSDRQQPENNHIQVNFSKGVNPMPPAHLIADDEVQTASNVDFSLFNGGLAARRGSTLVNALTSAAISTIFDNHNAGSSILQGNVYVGDAAGNLFRGTNTTSPMNPSFSNIASGLSASAPFPMAMAPIQKYMVIAGGTKNIKDDGTNVTDWVKQTPGAPTIVVNTLTPLSFTGAWTVPDGTLISSDTSTVVFSVDDGNTANGVLTLSSSTDMSLNGTHTIGDYGVQFINLAFSNPDQVDRISLDYSIGDATFFNYWHYELQPQRGGALVVRDNSQSLINAQTAVGSGTVPPTVDDRQTIWSQIAQYNFQPLSFIPSISNVSSPWAVPIPQFNLVAQNIVGTAGADLWKTIFAIRVGIITTGTCTTTVGKAALYGAVDFPLLDIQTGYTYWDTYATLDTSSNKLDEGPPGPSAGPFLMQNANASITHTGTATGSHGVTHRITYRQGGYLQDAYAVSTQTYLGGTAAQVTTDTLSDIDALTAGFIMQRNLIQQSQFPGYIPSIAYALGRVFIADQNLLRWSMPGMIGAFPLDSFVQVSDSAGDIIQAIIPWETGLIIINRSSIYTFYGNDLEAGDFTLSRTAARRGSVALKTIIKTPHGIPLLNQDGLTMFVPGYSQDQVIPWFDEKYGDMFKPSIANAKGNRIPDVQNNIFHASATWRNNKLYMAMCAGTATVPNTLFVLDFIKQQAWWYSYPFTIESLYADDRLIDMWAGDGIGNIFRIEDQLFTDINGTTTTPVVWTAKSKQWTVPSNACVENVSAESLGTKIVVTAVYDNTTNSIVSTLTNSLRQWSTPPLNGSFANSVEFQFTGTNSGGDLDILYGFGYDYLIEPVKVRYHRTGYDQQNHDADKLWDVQYYDIDISCTTGTTSALVMAVTYVDATAVMTYTWTGTTAGRQTFETAFPAETYGRVAYTTYTSTDTTVFFKPWSNDYQTRKEPAKVAYWRSDIISDPEREIKVFKPEINCNGGTVLATVVMNDIHISTHTITGTDRKQYTFSVPVEQYSRTTWAIYNGVNGNVFKVYSTMWDGPPEPPRVTLWRHGPNPYPASNYLKTWSPLLDPIGGSVLGTLIVNDVAIQTNTFTGNRRQWFTVGLDLDLGNVTSSHINHLSTGSRWEVVYSGTSQFKHYDTRMEVNSKPFEKRSWSYSYRKVGGASQVDMARFWSIFASVQAPAVATYWWDIDGHNFNTGTLTLTGSEWIDRIAFQPGARGREFQFRLLAPSLIKVRVVNVDLNQEGVKGLTRRGEVGTPAGEGPQAASGGAGPEE